MKHTEETKKRISETCKKNGIGKWMTGKKMSTESCIKRSEKMAIRIAEGKHNFYVDGRTKLPCPDCGGKKWRASEKCADCGVLRKDQHWNWKGGISTEAHLQRTSTEYRLWREAVFFRDNFTCQMCGARNGNGKTVILNADHIKPFAYYPELRTSIENGRTLCRPCHVTTFKEVSKHKQPWLHFQQ